MNEPISLNMFSDYLSKMLIFDNYIQIIIVIMSITIAKLVSKRIFYMTGNVVDHFHFKTTQKIETILERYLRPFISPLLAMVMLSITAVILVKSHKDQTIILSGMELSLVWLAIRVVKSFTNNNFISNIITAIIIPPAMLGVFDLLVPVIEYLDGFDFTIGNFRISIYILLRGIVILIFLSWFSFLLSKNIKSHIRKQFFINTNTKELLAKSLDILLYIVVFIIALYIFGFDPGSLIVFSGALTIVFGFGAQKIFANFMSGIILLCERSILVGDIIELSPGVLCFVRHLGGRYVRVETFDGKEIMIPNENLITMNVTNLTHTNNSIRVDIPMRLPYGIEINDIKKKIEDLILENPKCCKEPEPQFFISGFHDSYLGGIIMMWINDVSEGIYLVRHQIMTEVYILLEKENIKIPEQQIHYTTSGEG